MNRSADSPRRTTVDRPDVWTLAPGAPGFPPQLTSQPAVEFRLHGIGRAEILRSPCLGLICSVQCPGSVVMKTFDAIREIRDAGIVVAGGFHSPMEQECLEFLLRGRQAIIVCAAKHPAGVRLSDATRAALDDGRLLILSPFDKDVRRTTKANAHRRNDFVAALAAALLIPHASPRGKASLTAADTLAAGKPLFTFEELPPGMGAGIRRIDFRVAARHEARRLPAASEVPVALLGEAGE